VLIGVGDEPSRPVVTRLEGWLEDQFALQGVIDTHFRPGIRLVTFERLPSTPWRFLSRLDRRC